MVRKVLHHDASPSFKQCVRSIFILCVGLFLLSACAGMVENVKLAAPVTSHTYPNGDHYKGSLQDGLRHGPGVFTWANGDRYEGQWVRDQKQGQGTFTHHTGDEYVGQWKNDAMHGEGTFTWVNGDVYKGHYVNGKRHGNGTLTYADGRVEQGRWEYNQLAAVKEQDTTPPVIRITSHPMTRGIVVVPTLPFVQINGIAKDDSTVSEVTVNGQRVEVDDSGRFSVNLPVKSGRNEVLVIARDDSKNEAEKMFWLETQDTTQTEIPPPPTATGKLKTGRYHALIIGINDYKHLPKLETAVNDAREVDRLLRDRFGFTTTLILNATRSEIMNGFNRARETLSADDNLLVYYAGHGEFDKSVSKAYWLPKDAQPDNDTEWIIVDNITTNIRRMATRHVLVVADSCYSGTLTRSALTKLTTSEEKTKFLEKMHQRTSRTLMASGGNEPVADGGGGGHSIFAKVFLRALGNVQEDVFTAEQLFHGYIKESVAGSAEQVPEYNIIKNSGHQGGDFVFIRQ